MKFGHPTYRAAIRRARQRVLQCADLLSLAQDDADPSRLVYVIEASRELAEARHHLKRIRARYASYWGRRV